MYTHHPLEGRSACCWSREHNATVVVVSRQQKQAGVPIPAERHLKRGVSSRNVTITDAPRTAWSRGPESVSVQSVNSAAHSGPVCSTPDR